MQIFGDAIRFGIHSGQQNTTFQDSVQLWRQAEDLGYDWVSCFDHFLPIMSDPEGPCFEGFTMLSAMAAHTSRIRCGILVTGVTYRHPAVLANMATTIDHISGGRLELGMGAAWYELEHQQYGIPFPRAAQRIGMLEEAVQIVKGLWTQHRTTFQGRYYSVIDALSEPKPLQTPHTPIWVGGSGEKLTLRVVARFADGWNTFYGREDEYRHKLDVLAQHCEDAGRDPADIRKSLAVWMMLGDTERDVEDRLNAMAERTNSQVETIRQRGIAGTPEQCVERLLPFLKLGVGDFLVLARTPYDTRTLELLARQVAPAVKAEGKAVV